MSPQVGRGPVQDCGGSHRQKVGTTLRPALDALTLRTDGEKPCEVNQRTSCVPLNVWFTFWAAMIGANNWRFFCAPICRNARTRSGLGGRGVCAQVNVIVPGSGSVTLMT